MYCVCHGWSLQRRRTKLNLVLGFDCLYCALQIQGEGALATTGSSKAPVYRGLIGTLCAISRHEGPRALYNGLVPGLQRQLAFASVRIGLYDSVKEIYAGKLQGKTRGLCD